MSVTFWQTMPPLVIFSRPPQRRQVIMAYDARSRGKPPPARRSRGWIRHRVTLARIAAGGAVIYAGAVAEDIAGAIWSAVKPPPACQFGGAL